MSPALEATGLGVRYRRTWALRDCSLSVPAGRVAALVGPNGAGKTTLMHAAAAGRCTRASPSPRCWPSAAA
jgi:ABC-2 type transport system ATP-binding protein